VLVLLLLLLLLLVLLLLLLLYSDRDTRQYVAHLLLNVTVPYHILVNIGPVTVDPIPNVVKPTRGMRKLYLLYQSQSLTMAPQKELPRPRSSTGILLMYPNGNRR
jgi:hypothetical protein